MAKSFFMSGT